MAELLAHIRLFGRQRQHRCRRRLPLAVLPPPLPPPEPAVLALVHLRRLLRPAQRLVLGHLPEGAAVVTPALARFAADLDTARATSRALTDQWTELVAAYRAGRREPAHEQPANEES